MQFEQCCLYGIPSQSPVVTRGSTPASRRACRADEQRHEDDGCHAAFRNNRAPEFDCWSWPACDDTRGLQSNPIPKPGASVRSLVRIFSKAGKSPLRPSETETKRIVALTRVQLYCSPPKCRQEAAMLSTARFYAPLMVALHGPALQLVNTVVGTARYGDTDRCLSYPDKPHSSQILFQGRYGCTRTKTNATSNTSPIKEVEPAQVWASQPQVKEGRLHCIHHSRLRGRKPRPRGCPSYKRWAPRRSELPLQSK